MTRYVEAFSWKDTMDVWLETYVRERPVLHVCSGHSKWGDATVDLYEPADIRADWCSIPVPDDSYASVFADPPWNSGYKEDAARFIREALRIAPVVYLMAPWFYGGSAAPATRIWVRYMPGVNTPITIVRYVRPPEQLDALVKLEEKPQ